MSEKMPGMEMPAEEVLPEAVEGEVNPELDAEIRAEVEKLEENIAEVDIKMAELGGPEAVQEILMEAVTAEETGGKSRRDWTNKVMLASAVLAMTAGTLKTALGLQEFMFTDALGPLIDAISGIAKGVGASGDIVENIGGVNDAFAGSMEEMQNRVNLIGMYPAIATGISAAILKVKRAVTG